MTLSRRLVALVAVCLLAIGIAAWLVVRSGARHAAAPAARVSFAGLAGAPRIVFRSTERGPDYGAVAAVALADPAGPRGYLSSGHSPVECDRVYATAAHLLCLASDRGLDTTYSAAVYDTGADGVPKLQALPLAGVPSRARLSRDGTLAATTSFVAGDSYAETTFSTRTVISRVGGPPVGSLEDFRLVHQGKAIAPVDRNYWGVTFAADDDTFYATAEWAHHTWLVRGQLSTRTLRTLVEDAECPSLSPDGRHLVYKHRGGLPTGQWRLVAYTVADGATRQLPETHSVDDQVEWLTDSQVLYGLPRAGSQAAESDVWTVPIDGSGPPRLLIPDAWSPAVIR